MAASFTVNDLDKSVAWYRDVLGFVVGERWEDGGKVRGIQMKAGSCDIMLGQDDFAKGRDRKKGDGFRLWVATVQDITAVAARIKERGWALDREPSETPWGDWVFAVTDPDLPGSALPRLALRHAQPGGLALDVCEEAVAFDGIVLRSRLQHLDGADDRRERRAQLVRRVRHELTLG